MNTRPIRVLQLIKSLDRGGAEQLLTLMVQDADPLISHEVAFVRSDMAGLVDELRRAGIAVHDLGAHSDFHLGWTARLRHLLSTQRYDVMHAHSPYAAGLARLVTRTMARGSRPRLVYTEHSLWDHDRAASRWLGRTTSRWDDVRIAVGETNRAALPSALRARTQVVRHGIDLDHTVAESSAATVRAELGIPAEHLVVVTVANLRPQKGYPTLLAAARLILDSGLPVTFLAAGSGPLEDELRAEHRRLELGDSFRFLGQRSDAHSLIAASDVFVLASDWECMPVVVMEAFALGAPLVATAVGELPLVVEDGVNGLLVEPGDPAQLAAALRRVLSDESTRNALAAAASASASNFDVRIARQHVEGVYAELVSR